MNLGKLYEKVQTHDSGFISKLINENLDTNTLENVKQKIKTILNEADKYAADNDFKYRYIQMAKEPLWVDVQVKPEHFIYQGFDAYVNVDLVENIDDIVPYVVVQNSNVSSLKDGQRLDINEEFKKSMNDFQREIFEEALATVENRAINTLRKVWKFEKDRLNKWVSTCEVKLKGND